MNSKARVRTALNHREPDRVPAMMSASQFVVERLKAYLNVNSDRALLDAVGAQGQTLQMVALNDYAVNVPVSDAREFGPLLATHIDGKVLGVRDKGPLFLIYPFDAKPETRADQYYGRSIWQITRITVQ